MTYDVKDSSGGECKVDAAQRIIEGYANAFDNIDSHGDVVHKGAFAKTIMERKERIRVLADHMHPIGKPTEMREDDFGLFTVSKISETPRGDETLQLAGDGILDMSIGYTPVKMSFDKMDEEPVRVLSEIKLYEYSLVAFPSNEKAVVTGVKGQGSEELASLLLRLPRMLADAQGFRSMTDKDRDILSECASKATVLLASAERDLERFEVQRYVFTGMEEDAVKSWVNDDEVKIYRFGDLWVAGLERAEAFASLKTIEVEEGISAVGGVKTYHAEDAAEEVFDAAQVLADSLGTFFNEDTPSEPSEETKTEPELTDDLEALLARVSEMAKGLKSGE